jgi:hypothetical protein
MFALTACADDVTDEGDSPTTIVNPTNVTTPDNGTNGTNGTNGNLTVTPNP